LRIENGKKFSQAAVAMSNFSIAGKAIPVEHQAAALYSSGFTLNTMKLLSVINNKVVLMPFSKGKRDKVSRFD